MSAPDDSFNPRPLRLLVAGPWRDKVAPKLHGVRTSESSHHMDTPVISCSPDVMGGTPVFAGTRVPVQTLLDYLEAGDSIDEFLAGFPSVSREQVFKFLEQAKDRLVAAAS